MNKHSTIATLLLEVEKALRERGLWSSEPPSSRALASTQPFAIDTLEFQQWLQFIFLPRMAQLVETGAPLPQNCGIAPIAEQAFKQAERDESVLIAQLVEIDRVLSGE